MTWEQRWMRRLIKAAVWAVALYAASYELGVATDWRVVLLVLICGLVDNVADAVLPTADT